MDRVFTERDILEHKGQVSIFCPAVEEEDSKYKRVEDVALFVKNVFKSQFRPQGRIERKEMLICLFPKW